MWIIKWGCEAVIRVNWPSGNKVIAIIHEFGEADLIKTLDKPIFLFSFPGVRGPHRVALKRYGHSFGIGGDHCRCFELIKQGEQGSRTNSVYTNFEESGIKAKAVRNQQVKQVRVLDQNPEASPQSRRVSRELWEVFRGEKVSVRYVIMPGSVPWDPAILRHFRPSAEIYRWWDPGVTWSATGFFIWSVSSNFRISCFKVRPFTWSLNARFRRVSAGRAMGWLWVNQPIVKSSIKMIRHRSVAGL
jgi:hypothetical protein